jgi:hypothetical protein
MQLYIIRKGSTLGDAFGFAFAERTLNNKDASEISIAFH